MVETGSTPARATSLPMPSRVNGLPRSLMNTNGDVGFCSRFSRRSARSSRPASGCTLGSPFLIRRTCTLPRSRSISAQRSEHASDACSPCRNMTSSKVASRWPYRLADAALISRSTSASVRYSRVRSFGVRLAAGANCPHFVGWRYEPQCWICHGKSLPPTVDRLHNGCFADSRRTLNHPVGAPTGGLEFSAQTVGRAYFPKHLPHSRIIRRND